MKVHEKLGTKNQIKCGMMKGPSVPWVTDPNNENFQAAFNAIETVRGVKPDLTREGCSIPGNELQSDIKIQILFSDFGIRRSYWQTGSFTAYGLM